MAAASLRAARERRLPGLSVLPSALSQHIGRNQKFHVRQAMAAQTLPFAKPCFWEVLRFRALSRGASALSSVFNLRLGH
jgi:hypothetical protein